MHDDAESRDKAKCQAAENGGLTDASGGRAITHTWLTLRLRNGTQSVAEINDERVFDPYGVLSNVR